VDREAHKEIRRNLRDFKYFLEQLGEKFDIETLTAQLEITKVETEIAREAYKQESK